MIRTRTIAVTCVAALALSGGLRADDTVVSPKLNAAATTGPRLKFDAVEINLGDVIRGQDAVATFTYRNVGDAPLKILSAKPG